MLHSEIKISIVTPTFNCSDFVIKTFKSILNQTHKNLEVIAIDDASTDDTVEKIKSFNDDRIKLSVNSENKGAAYCRNFAISKCTGDYIAFLDGDDLWKKDKLEKQLSFMLDNNVAFSYTNYYVLDNGKNRITCYYTGPKVVNHKKFIKLDYVGCLTVMYKRSVFPELSIPNDISKRNDYALWLRLSEKADCYLLNETLSIYRSRSNSISSINKFKLIKYHKIVFKKLYNYNGFKCMLFALRNVFFYVLKRVKYKKRIKGIVDYEL